MLSFAVKVCGDPVQERHLPAALSGEPLAGDVVHLGAVQAARDVDPAGDDGACERPEDGRRRQHRRADPHAALRAPDRPAHAVGESLAVGGREPDADPSCQVGST